MAKSQIWIEQWGDGGGGSSALGTTSIENFTRDVDSMGRTDIRLSCGDEILTKNEAITALKATYGDKVEALLETIQIHTTPPQRIPDNETIGYLLPPSIT